MVTTPLGERYFANGMDGRLAADLGKYFKRVRLNQGAQILRVPEGSRITDLTLSGGASFKSKWAALRGSVLKFHVDRGKRAVKINGNCWAVPAGHALMDEASLRHAIDVRNAGKGFPYRQVNEISSSEPMYLAHFCFCHPEQLFLPQGRFLRTAFFADAQRHSDTWQAYTVNEIGLVYEGRSIDILTAWGITARSILVTLTEGGQILLEDLSDE